MSFISSSSPPEALLPHSYMLGYSGPYPAPWYWYDMVEAHNNNTRNAQQKNKENKTTNSTTYSFAASSSEISVIVGSWCSIGADGARLHCDCSSWNSFFVSSGRFAASLSEMKVIVGKRWRIVLDGEPPTRASNSRRGGREAFTVSVLKDVS